MYIVRHHHNIQPSWNYHFVIQEKQMINGNQIKSIYAKGQLTSSNFYLIPTPITFIAVLVVRVNNKYYYGQREFIISFYTLLITI